MVWDGSTDTERVNYFLEATTTDHLQGAMALMHDALVSPLFEPKELERERAVVLGELDRKDATPSYHLFQAVQRHVWWKYTSRKLPVGRRETVEKATPVQMRTIQRRYYVPNNSVLVVVGDVSAADIFEQADALYGAWQRAPDPFVRYPLVKHPPIRRSEVVLVEQPVHTVTGQFVWQGPSAVGPTVPDSYIADAFTHVLNLPSSRFRSALVDSGACLSAGMGWRTQVNTGPITLSFEATPEKVDSCVSEIVAILSDLRDSAYAGNETLQRAAHDLEVNEVSLRQEPSSFAHDLTFWWASSGLDYHASYIGKVAAVKHTDVAHYVDTYISGKPYVFAVLVSPEMRKSGLDAPHFEALLGLKKGAR